MCSPGRTPPGLETDDECMAFLFSTFKQSCEVNSTKWAEGRQGNGACDLSGDGSESSGLRSEAVNLDWTVGRLCLELPPSVQLLSCRECWGKCVRERMQVGSPV
uniref:Uncharacterized protein n=1 Tax=Meleagris gallopavo TaxID=9103 RepID=A0A803XQB9_MELGA